MTDYLDLVLLYYFVDLLCIGDVFLLKDCLGVAKVCLSRHEVVYDDDLMSLGDELVYYV